MIIVDKELSEREQGGNPIKVAIVGAGFMGRGIAIQLLTAVRGAGSAIGISRGVRPASRDVASGFGEDRRLQPAKKIFGGSQLSLLRP